MERLTLREAAQRTARSITTLRRYIRSGRLRAEKRFGRFGPEYYISPVDLAEAGFELDPQSRTHHNLRAIPQRAGGSTGSEETSGQAMAREATDQSALSPVNQAPLPPAVQSSGAAELVPMTLFQELQMKHEQLLVQYGMIRAAGMRTVDLQQKLERSEQKIDELERSNAQHGRAQAIHEESQEQELRQSQLELKGRALEIAALKEKVRALEMLTRNAVTNETIENQFGQVLDQTRRVDRLGDSARAIQPPSDAGPRPKSWSLGPMRKNRSVTDNDA
jgi:hypothetical protein